MVASNQVKNWISKVKPLLCVTLKKVHRSIWHQFPFELFTNFWGSSRMSMCFTIDSRKSLFLQKNDDLDSCNKDSETFRLIMFFQAAGKKLIMRELLFPHGIHHDITLGITSNNLGFWWHILRCCKWIFVVFLGNNWVRYFSNNVMKLDPFVTSALWHPPNSSLEVDPHLPNLLGSTFAFFELLSSVLFWDWIPDF